MGQKINPVGFRLGIIRGWDSSWFGGKSFADKLVEDEKIRKYISARIQKGGISKVVIERTLKRITLTIHTARPGVVIGKGGTEVDKIKEELKKLSLSLLYRYGMFHSFAINATCLLLYFIKVSRFWVYEQESPLSN